MICHRRTYQSQNHLNYKFNRLKDMPNMQFLLLFFLAFYLTSSFMEFQIIRNPHFTKKLPLAKSQCQDPKTVSEQAKYTEICYEKDIAYVFQFDHLNHKKYLALDLTSPISWIKNQECKVLDNNKTCTLLKESFNQKIKTAFKQKITSLIQKLKKKIEDDDSKAIIEGSNEIVMGEVDQIKNLSIVAKNNGHLSKFFDIILLGLYIIGEKDTVTLNTTSFINAHKITPNLNTICDGAISLRFDQNSQKSFLNEVFAYMKSKPTDNLISIYLGKDKSVVTIGGISSKYAENGLSSFAKVKMIDSQFGKLPHLQGVIFENNDEQNTIQADSQLVFSLSASYIGFVKNITDKMLKEFFPSTLKCKINSFSYIQCQKNNQDDVDMLKSASLDIDLDTSMIHFAMKDLILKDQKNTLVFNIKQTQCDNSIVGEPFFSKYYTYFDYHKNEIGYAPRKLTLQESFISAITFIHFIIITILLGLCFLITSDSFKKVYYHIFQKISAKAHESIKKTLKTYQPVVDEQEDKEENKPRASQLEDDVEGI